MPDESHTLMDGKLHVYKRENSRFWQCSTYIGSRNHRATTKEESLTRAIEFARDWYMLRYAEERQRRTGMAFLQSGSPTLAVPVDAPTTPVDKRRRPVVAGPTFNEAAKAFIAEYNVITQGERNAHYVKQKSLHVDVHLTPFFGGKALSEITAGLIQDYRVHRQTSRVNAKTGEPERPSRSTLHAEMVTLRQIMKTANRKGWIAALPDMTVAYKKSGKVEHRAWFSPDEYKMLYEATRERAKHPKKERWRSACEDLHDYVLFMGNTGLRPDECSRLEDRDVTIVNDAATGERILEIEVRGKRGVGYCKSMPGAVHPYQRIRERKKLNATDLIFGKVQRELLNTILNELNLKHDREGNERTAYSLRHTYICMRLMEGADIYQVAKNCRTSVEMIEKHYAAHIKNRLDTSAINVRKAKPTATVIDKDAPVGRTAKAKAAKQLTKPRAKQ